MRARASRARRALLLSAIVALPILACQSLLGIEDDRFTVASPEAGAEASADATTELPDLCAHTGPRARPEAGAGGVSREFVFALDSYVLDDGTAGFDLDGVCTCNPLDRSLGGGRDSCIAPTDASTCDDDGGVDNRLGFSLAGIKSVLDVSGIFNRQVACGGETVLLVLSDYNGEADDPDVKLQVVETLGILGDDGGVDAGPDCAVQGQPPTAPPKRDGKDVWNVPRGALARPEIRGWVRDFHLVVDARKSPATLPFTFGRTLVTLSGAAIEGRLVPMDADGGDLPIVDGRVEGGPAAQFRLTDAVLAGRAPVLQVVVGAGLLNQGGYVCNSPAWSFVKRVICGTPDTVENVADDLAGRPCDAVSIGARLEAVPAQRGPERERTETTPCGPNWAKQTCN